MRNKQINNKIKKWINYISVTWILIVGIRFTLGCFDIYSTIILLENIYKLLLLFVWLIPLAYIFYIKDKIIRYLLIVLCSVLGIYCIGMLSFLSMFLINDLFTGNGYKQIFNTKLKNNTIFSIYKSPDMGALGGNWTIYSIDKKIIPGLVHRRKLNYKDYILSKDYIHNTERIIIGLDTITLNKSFDDE